jgi:hypothetical protein
MQKAEVFIVTGKRISPLERKAAEELHKYLKRLFGISVDIVSEVPESARAYFLIGSPYSNETISGIFQRGWPNLSEEGFLLRSMTYKGSPSIIAGGNTPKATLWSVYELLEEYGVRYLLHEDIIPDLSGAFHIPSIDKIFEPRLKTRSWRLMCGLPHGPETWGLAQHKKFIEQLAKLKFNSVYLSLWPWHPFVECEYKGIQRRTATLNFGNPYSIDEHSIGYQHIPCDNWSYNPEFHGVKSYKEMIEVGQRLIRGILEYAKEFGMKRVIVYQPLEFPHEFAPILQKPKIAKQVGNITTSEGGDLNNPEHLGLVSAYFRSYLETFPDINEIILEMPEHPHSEAGLEKAWAALNRKGRLEPDLTLSALLYQASNNYIKTGGPARALRELKSSINMTYFFNNLFDSTDLLQVASEKDIKVGLVVDTELVQVIDRLLWPDARLVTGLGGYTNTRAIYATKLVENLDTQRLPTTFVMTLQDDNVGPLPQIDTENCHHMLEFMTNHGWQGYHTRYWPIDDLDPVAAYLSKASWERSFTPESVYQDHALHLYGETCVRPFTLIMNQLQQMTFLLHTEYLSLFFPVPTIMARHLDITDPMEVGLYHVCGLLQRCKDLFKEMTALPKGSDAIDFWLARIDFSLALFEESLALRAAARLYKSFFEHNELDEKSKCRREFEENISKALNIGKDACQILASHIRNDSNRGLLAAYNRFMLREVQEKAEELLNKMKIEYSI